MKAAIRPLVVGWLTVDRTRLLPTASPAEIDVPAIAWLVQAPDATVLVDTGPGDPEAAHRRGHRNYRRAADDSLDRSLRRVDVEPNDIDIVVLTHLHWDHAGDNRLFPDATFVVQRAELEFSRRPTPEQRGLYDTDAGTPHPLHGVKCEEHDGDAVLLPGVDLIAAPGHTPGSQALSVAADGARFVIAGDTVPLAATMTGTEPTPSTIRTDRSALRASLRSLAALDAIVLPAHEPALAAFDGLDLTEHEEDLCARLR